MPQTSPIEDVLAKLRASSSAQTWYGPGQRDEILNLAMAPLKDATPEVAAEFVLTGLRIVRGEPSTWFVGLLNHGVRNVLRRKLTFTEDQLLEIIGLVSVPNSEFPYKGILNAVELSGMTPRVSEALRQLRPCITEYLGGSEARDLHARIDILLNGPTPRTSLPVQGAWSQVVFQKISGSAQNSGWERIFFHSADLKSSAASGKWRATARRLVETLGQDVFLAAAARWLALGPSPDRPGVQISSGEAVYQAGFLWFLAGQMDERLPALLAGFAEAALKKIPMLGAVSQKVGNACVNVLAELPGLEPVSQLSRLAQRVRYDTAQRLIEEALNRAAENAGITREQLEEMSTSDCGLGLDGTRTERFGDYSVRVSIAETTTAILEWSDASGRPLKSVPSYVKEHHAEEWKDLQRAVKDTEKMLSAHRARMERLLLTQRAIPIETLRTCYLDHPLLADMSRRLIWQFEGGLGLWRDGRLIDSGEREIGPLAQETARLWHPVASDVQTIFHWRCWLEDHGIRQPFKQAHREVYLITEAERETSTYSNRFAAHILRQPQFAALAAQRGWEFRLMGQWDSHNTPTLELPQFGLRVEYEVDFPANEEEVTGHHIYLLIRTGKVRFLDGNRTPRNLESIPSVVFSEVMRDIDLFTGVTSIGNDPAWGQGRPAPFQEYWSAFSFGELTEMAKNRASILERILPRLSIRDRCRLDGRFLAVRGDLATYRIHLGSGNVLMEPGSRYLCIVEGAATKSKPRNLALPFEDDHKLSQILSKAFLLADDRNIKDQSILRQFPGLPDAVR
jgi:hypothetical protein